MLHCWVGPHNRYHSGPLHLNVTDLNTVQFDLEKVIERNLQQISSSSIRNVLFFRLNDIPIEKTMLSFIRAMLTRTLNSPENIDKLSRLPLIRNIARFGVHLTFRGRALGYRFLDKMENALQNREHKSFKRPRRK